MFKKHHSNGYIDADRWMSVSPNWVLAVINVRPTAEPINPGLGVE
jgi:hypothetical protein